ncbi:MAG: hypothetical protein ACRDWV_03285 [Acidimicrobiales bacterium]
MTESPANTRTFRLVRNTTAAVCLVVVVILVSVLVGRAASKPSAPVNYGTVNLPYRSAAPDFASLNSEGVIPANVLDAISVPTNANLVSKAALDQGLSDYKVTLTYESPSSAAALKHFLPAVLSRQQWRLESSSSILALHAGRDGDYWDLGVAVVGRSSAKKDAEPSGSRFTLTLEVASAGA